MNIFLTSAELRQLTDSIKPSKQREWLDREKWIYKISRLGNVKVLRRYAEMRMGIPLDQKTSEITEPDFSRIAS